jgi:hypothetical protein
MVNIVNHFESIPFPHDFLCDKICLQLRHHGAIESKIPHILIQLQLISPENLKENQK